MKNYIKESVQIALLLLLQESAGASELGVWIKQSNFSQINAGCLQTWTCHPQQDILHASDMYVAVTKPKLMTGVCSVGNGAFDSCNVCISSKPSEICKWELRKH